MSQCSGDSMKYLVLLNIFLSEKTWNGVKTLSILIVIRKMKQIWNVTLNIYWPETRYLEPLRHTDKKIP